MANRKGAKKTEERKAEVPPMPEAEAPAQTAYRLVGCVLLIAVTYVSMNLIVDVTYSLLDPRVRHD